MARPGKRRLRNVLAGAAVVACVLLAALGLTELKRGAAASACLPARAPTTGPAVSAEGGLVVAEQGFSKFHPWSHSLGAVVANNSPRAAYRTRFTLRMLDADGLPLWSGEPREIPLIMPGQRLAVGAGVDVPAEGPFPVARMSVELGETHWVAVDHGNMLFQTFDTRAQSKPANTTNPADTYLWLSPNGDNESHCGGLSQKGAGIVFRGADGAIVGGASGGVRDGSYCAGSHFEEGLGTFAVPAGTDLTRTQVSVYCDIAEPG
ncbi:hypothetical protein ABT297_28220 [Dactylosporangium sp. NPDC000555]|uniref:hypothetical protein n=1 Tax=Dactylosporangium sp. NPDC000555 TaxID=3154260 RepID=UPI00332B1018